MSPIYTELETRLNTLAATLGIPVAYEGLEFDKPTGAFLDCTFIPSGTFNVTVDGTRKRETGVLKVNVWYPTGSGAGDARAIAQSVVDAFPIVPKTGLVSIESTPSVGRLLTDESGWIILPVTISYRYEH